MTRTRLDRPRRLSCLFFLSAVILSTLSPCQFLCVAVWIAPIVRVSVHHFLTCIFVCIHNMYVSVCTCLVCVCLCVFGMFPAPLIVSLEKQTPSAAGAHLH